MDFRRALTLVSEFLEREGYSYAVVGAFALQSYGFARATQDVDFVTEAAARDELVAFLEAQVERYFRRYGLEERFDEIASGS